MTDAHPLKLANSLTRKRQQFKPINPKRVTMYNCGPTVYSYAHIGNARAAVVADVLFRTLHYIYGKDHVVYARNITDVDDKIIASAKEQGVDISEITKKYARIYNEDLAAIGCLMPTEQPKATDNIQEMADIIVELMEKDIAYASEGHVFFDVSKHKEYGELSGNSLEQLKKGNRVEEAEYARKRNAADFVLWKPATSDDVGWDNATYFKKKHIVDAINYEVPNWREYSNEPIKFTSGRPGWHIECSAMIRNTLGETIDIHCGGIDLKFPHHENEIAQSHCANDKPLANFWVHNEFLNMGSEKMSKSLGNVTLIKDLLEQWDGEVIRLALLKAHYRSELLWTEDLLRESKKQLDGWYRVFKKYSAYVRKGRPSKKIMKFFLNDLNTPDIFALIPDLLSYTVEVMVPSDPVSESGEKLLDFTTVDNFSTIFNMLSFFGLLQKDPDEWFRGGLDYDALVAEYDSVRAQALAAKEAGDKAKMGQMFARSDELRDQFKSEGIIVESSKDGKSSWRKA